MRVFVGTLITFTLVFIATLHSSAFAYLEEKADECYIYRSDVSKHDSEVEDLQQKFSNYLVGVCRRNFEINEKFYNIVLPLKVNEKSCYYNVSKARKLDGFWIVDRDLKFKEYILLNEGDCPQHFNEDYISVSGSIAGSEQLQKVLVLWKQSISSSDDFEHSSNSLPFFSRISTTYSEFSDTALADNTQGQTLSIRYIEVIENNSNKEQENKFTYRLEVRGESKTWILSTQISDEEMHYVGLSEVIF